VIKKQKTEIFLLFLLLFLFLFLFFWFTMFLFYFVFFVFMVLSKILKRKYDITENERSPPNASIH